MKHTVVHKEAITGGARGVVCRCKPLLRKPIYTVSIGWHVIGRTPVLGDAIGLLHSALVHPGTLTKGGTK